MIITAIQPEGKDRAIVLRDLEAVIQKAKAVEKSIKKTRRVDADQLYALSLLLSKTNSTLGRIAADVPVASAFPSGDCIDVP